MTIGERVKQLRMGKNMNQLQFGRILCPKGSSETIRERVSLIENNQLDLTVTQLIRLAEHFKIAPAMILGAFPFENSLDEYQVRTLDHIQKDICTIVRTGEKEFLKSVASAVANVAEICRNLSDRGDEVARLHTIKEDYYRLKKEFDALKGETALTTTTHKKGGKRGK